MSPIAWASVLFITVPISFLLLQTLASDTGTRKVVRQNLLTGPAPAKAKKAKTPNDNLNELAGRLAPKSYVHWLNGLLNRAGRPAEMPLQRLLVIKPL